MYLNKYCKISKRKLKNNQYLNNVLPKTAQPRAYHACKIAHRSLLNPGGRGVLRLKGVPFMLAQYTKGQESFWFCISVLILSLSMKSLSP